MKAKCKYCGYEWIMRVEIPKTCPKCKRYGWEDKEEEKKNEITKRIKRILRDE